jgi:hypothetical protein
MAKSNTRKNEHSHRISYPQGKLIANLAFLKEYLARYLQTRPGRIVIRGNDRILRLHQYLSGILQFGGNSVELSLLAFDPMRCEPPKTILTSDLSNWPHLITSGALEQTRRALERQYPYFALYLFVKGEPKTTENFLLSLRSKVFLWISESDRKKLNAEILQDACLFSELYFDQQIQEICKMYGSGIAFSPSLQ